MQPTTWTAWVGAFIHLWAPGPWYGLTVFAFQNQRLTPLIKSSCHWTGQSNQFGLNVTSPPPKLPTRTAFGWRTDRRSPIREQSRGTRRTGDKHLRSHFFNYFRDWKKKRKEIPPAIKKKNAQQYAGKRPIRVVMVDLAQQRNSIASRSDEAVFSIHKKQLLF